MTDAPLTAAELADIEARVDEERAQYYSTSHGDDESFEYIANVAARLLSALRAVTAERDEARALVESAKNHLNRGVLRSYWQLSGVTQCQVCGGGYREHAPYCQIGKEESALDAIEAALAAWKGDEKSG